MMDGGSTRNRPEIILGLTGSIGMGKTVTAGFFEKLGVPVHDSDAAVHRLYEAGGRAGAAIAQAFPKAVKENGSVDLEQLRNDVLGKPDALSRLETLVHPLVGDDRQSFLEKHADAALAVLDIPLLFEIGAEKYCDAVLVVTAPADVQQARVLARSGMTEAVFRAILAKQMSDMEKRARADFVIDTSVGFEHAEAAVAAVVAQLMDRH